MGQKGLKTKGLAMLFGYEIPKVNYLAITAYDLA